MSYYSKLTIEVGPWTVECTVDGVLIAEKPEPVSTMWSGRLLHEDGREAFLTPDDRDALREALYDEDKLAAVFEGVMANSNQLVTIPG